MSSQNYQNQGYYQSPPNRYQPHYTQTQQQHNQGWYDNQDTKKNKMNFHPQKMPQRDVSEYRSHSGHQQPTIQPKFPQRAPVLKQHNQKHQLHETVYTMNQSDFSNQNENFMNGIQKSSIEYSGLSSGANPPNQRAQNIFKSRTEIQTFGSPLKASGFGDENIDEISDSMIAMEALNKKYNLGLRSFDHSSTSDHDVGYEDHDHYDQQAYDESGGLMRTNPTETAGFGIGASRAYGDEIIVFESQNIAESSAKSDEVNFKRFSTLRMVKDNKKEKCSSYQKMSNLSRSPMREKKALTGGKGNVFRSENLAVANPLRIELDFDNEEQQMREENAKKRRYRQIGSSFGVFKPEELEDAIQEPQSNFKMRRERDMTHTPPKLLTPPHTGGKSSKSIKSNSKHSRQSKSGRSRQKSKEKSNSFISRTKNTPTPSELDVSPRNHSSQRDTSNIFERKTSNTQHKSRGTAHSKKSGSVRCQSYAISSGMKPKRPIANKMGRNSTQQDEDYSLLAEDTITQKYSDLRLNEYNSLIKDIQIDDRSVYKTQKRRRNPELNFSAKEDNLTRTSYQTVAGVSRSRRYNFGTPYGSLNNPFNWDVERTPKLSKNKPGRYFQEQMMASVGKELKYIGGTLDDVYHGEGKILTYEGDLIYEGSFQKGLYHGKGKLFNYLRKTKGANLGISSEIVRKYMSISFPNYRKDTRGVRGLTSLNFEERGWVSYDGYWKNGKMDGYGKLVLEDGRSFEGEFAEGQANGNGIMQGFGKKVLGLWERNVIKNYL